MLDKSISQAKLNALNRQFLTSRRASRRIYIGPAIGFLWSADKRVIAYLITMY